MPRRTSRLRSPRDPDRKLAQLGKARDALVGVRTEVVINSALYRAAGDAMKAIDAVAEEMTGDEEYFTPMKRY